MYMNLLTLLGFEFTKKVRHEGHFCIFTVDYSILTTYEMSFYINNFFPYFFFLGNIDPNLIYANK